MKDRVAAAIIEEGLASKRLRPGGLITEGTAGSTGVSLAMLAPAEGCRCYIAMPDDAAQEKATMLRVRKMHWHLAPVLETILTRPGMNVRLQIVA